MLAEEQVDLSKPETARPRLGRLEVATRERKSYKSPEERAPALLSEGLAMALEGGNHSALESDVRRHVQITDSKFFGGNAQELEGMRMSAKGGTRIRYSCVNLTLRAEAAGIEPGDLTDAQWGLLHQLIPEPKRREDGRGRPWKGHREVLNGILYILRSGVAWADLPGCYPPYQTCHRRFQQWLRSGVMGPLLKALTTDLLETESRVCRLPLSTNEDDCPEVSDANATG
jgi:transposase